MNGSSTICSPMKVSIKKFPINIQNKNLLKGLNCLDFIKDFSNRGTKNKTNKEENRAKTPNSLSGIDLKIA